jgi:hypothetical protein
MSRLFTIESARLLAGVSSGNGSGTPSASRFHKPKSEEGLPSTMFETVSNLVVTLAVISFSRVFGEDVLRTMSALNPTWSKSAFLSFSALCHIAINQEFFSENK